ncbi:UrcA family protein [Novosphingobium kunmingense]|uniref:UrcA family protein n=1 Tax=Novosphingobium kunmingense TaxID=1211806 RepID=A0A2N0HJT5_9SPHN|nr:UrcA family protein [Novosphingobium kunmingense]PKB19210.1 UrcA family protein [Novosphingobium kunmingense]
MRVLLIGLAASLLAATPSLAGSYPIKVRIAHGDLDLTTAQGAEAFNDRARVAITAACEAPSLSKAQSTMETRRCIDGAMTRALAAMEKKRLQRVALNAN